MARIDEAIARQVAAAMVAAMLEAWGALAASGDGRSLDQVLIDRAQQVTLTTDGVLVLRFDVTQPKAEPAPDPMPDSATVAFPTDPEPMPDGEF